MSTQLESVAIDWKGLFEKMDIGVAIHRIYWDETGKPVDIEYLDVNPAFETITGRKKTDVVGKRTSVLYPNLESVFYENYGKVVKTGQPMEFEQYAKDLDIHFRVYSFKTGDNEFCSVFQDITKHKKYELELDKKISELEFLNKLMVDRELKMVQIKKENDELKRELANK